MALFNKDPIPTKPATPTRRSETPSLLGNPPSSHTANMQKSSSSAKPNDGADPHPASESRLIVGPNIKLKGVEIEDCDTLVVEGYVEASMDSRVIEIAETGVYKGKVDIDTAIIRGRFEGELTAWWCMRPAMSAARSATVASVSKKVGACTAIWTKSIAPKPGRKKRPKRPGLRPTTRHRRQRKQPNNTLTLFGQQAIQLSFQIYKTFRHRQPLGPHPRDHLSEPELDLV